MRLQFKKRRLIPVAIAMAAVIAVSGVAYAYWTASGSGTGDANAAAGISNLTVNQAAALNDMYPGDPTQTTSVTIHNGSAESVHVTTVSITDVTTDKGLNCDASNFTIGVPVTPWAPAGLDIAAGTTSAAAAGPTIHFKNLGTNQDLCKGAAVTVHYSVS